MNKETMSSLQIAEVTGMRHSDVMRSIRNMEKAWVNIAQRNFALGSYTDANNQSRPCYELTKTECLYIATKFNDEARAKLVLRWEELETGKAQPIAQIHQETKQQSLKDKLLWVKETKKLLNINDASVLGMLKEIATPLGLPLPDYTPSRGILKSASELLKENGSTMSAQAFNARLIELGYLTELSRPSSNGSVKKFKSITEKGLEYGENQVNPNNPKSTQPLWYADRFNEFMNVVK